MTSRPPLSFALPRFRDRFFLIFFDESFPPTPFFGYFFGFFPFFLSCFDSSGQLRFLLFFFRSGDA